MTSSERASQEQQIGANFSFIAPSSEELLTHSLTHSMAENGLKRNPPVNEGGKRVYFERGSHDDEQLALPHVLRYTQRRGLYTYAIHAQPKLITITIVQ